MGPALAIVLAAALAGSAQADEARVDRWEVVDEQDGDRGSFDGTPVRIVRAAGDDELRLRCPDGVEPRRRALVASGESVVPLAGPFSIAEGGEQGSWTFPVAHRSLDTWLLEPPDCEVRRLDRALPARGLARLEQAADDVAALRSVVTALRPFDRRRMAWLGGSPADLAWLHRYLALRASGPHPTDLGARRPAPGAVRAGPDAAERPLERPWWLAPPGPLATVSGPARIVVWARPLEPAAGDGALACLGVDGAPHCQSLVRSVAVRFDDGALVQAAEEIAGREVGTVRVWTLLVGAGEHSLSLDGASLVRISVGDGSDFLAGRVAPPDQPVVWPPDVSAGAAPAWPVSPAGAGVHEGVLTKPSSSPIGAEAARWVSLTTLAEAIAAQPAALETLGWIDDGGVARLWLEPPGPTAHCSVSFGGGASFAAQGPTGVHRFQWSGGAEPGLPERATCPAWLRIEGSDLAVPSLALSRFAFPVPGAQVTWDLQAADETTLWVSWPSAPQRAAEMTLSIDGEPSWSLAVPADAATMGAADGAEWTVAVPLRLGRGRSSLTVTSPERVALRVTQRRPTEALFADVPAAPAADPAPRPDAGGDVPVESAARAADVRAISAALAVEQTIEGRVDLLLRRSELLARAGQWRLADLDQERALALKPTAVPDESGQGELRRQRALLLVGPGAWLPLDSGWLGDDAGAAELAGLAAAGDFVRLARPVSDPASPVDPRPWWRRAILGGQVLQPSDRIAAYVDLVERTPAEERSLPFLAPLRTVSRWERITAARGSLERVTVAWPAPPADLGADLFEDALFPDPWPADRRLRLRRGWNLELPPGEARVIEVRCRSTWSVGELDACRFDLLDVHGDAVASVRSLSDGLPVGVEVPATDGPLYLSVRPSGGVVAEALSPVAPEGAAAPAPRRAAWKVAAGREVQFDVLGPTVVRVEAWSPSGEPVGLTVTVGPLTGRGEAGEHSLTDRREVEVVVRRSGPTRVRVRPSQSVLLACSMRVPSPRSPEPPGDRRRVAASLAPGSGRPGDPAVQSPTGSGTTGLLAAQTDASDDALWDSPAPLLRRPAQVPPVSLVVTLRGGLGEDADQEPEERSRWRLRSSQELRLVARPARRPLWLESRVVLEEQQGYGPVVTGAAGLDWRPVSRAVRLWVTADARLSGGRLGAGPALSGHLAGSVRIERFLAPHWQVLVRLAGQGRGLLAGEEPADGTFDSQLQHWSRFKAQHPWTLRPDVALRFVPGPWLRVGVYGALASNAPRDHQPLDHATIGLEVGGQQPALWVRGFAELDLWLPDAYRAAFAASPDLGVAVGGMLWPGRDVGVELRADVRYQHRFAQLAAVLTVRLHLSRDRALGDLRPSRSPPRFALGWSQDRAALRRLRRTSP